MIARQHVWLGPEATTFSEPCEACLRSRGRTRPAHALVSGSLRRDADVGFATCRRGHRIVVHRVGRALVAGTR
ncbi:MAG TPA: hypothetical protein VFA19_01915 [Gaiellaceae bacterium]|nr:hypothetical protein [Gaiellaceae bacterium]